MFKGSLVALITPFKDGKVDEDAFQRFVEWQIEQGTHGLVPCGTTGESPTLSHDEHKRVVELCIEAAAGRVPVIAGAGSNLYARAFDRPATITRLPGILVLVPGSLGFLSITELMRESGDPLRGLQDGFAGFAVALALVTGLLVSNAIIPPRKAL